MSIKLWTSEAVSGGHPDKVADQIADALLDECLKVNCNARVAIEVVVTRKSDGKDVVILTGEASCSLDSSLVKRVVSNTLREIGYTTPETGFDSYDFCLENYIREQSKEIAEAVLKEENEIGAGDQGIMFGFACDETDTFMPLAHYLAHDIINILEELRIVGNSPLYPDAKSQVTLAYNLQGPVGVNNVVISTSHVPGLSLSEVADYVRSHVIPEIGAAAKGSYGAIQGLFNDWTQWHINPGGKWNIGGPASDTGLSGRKIVVDNYGADCPIGGGSFSGKDATKVDRSGAYAARHIAVNLVAAGLCKAATVQIGYGIGLINPTSLNVTTNSKKVEDSTLVDMVRRIVPLTPRAIIERFGLKNPQGWSYKDTASGGHFGHDYPWDKSNLTDDFFDHLNTEGAEPPY